MLKIIFQRILMLRKYFWIFVKAKKVLEKIPACKSVLKIQICSGGNRKVKKSKMVKNKYEIRTNLPSGRARRFETDERDLSPALTYHCLARPGEVDEDELATFRHTFFDRLLLDRVVVGSLGRILVHPKALALRHPVDK